MSNTKSLVGPLFFLLDLAFLDVGMAEADFLLAAFLATLFRCEEAGAMAAFSALAMACADSNEARWVGAGGNGMNRGLG